MSRWQGGMVVLSIAAGACGRSTPATRPGADAGDVASADRVADPLGAADGALDLRPAVLEDAGAPPPDLSSPGRACEALKKLADRDLLIKARTNEVHFAPDGSWLALRVRADAPDGASAPDRLVRVDLPSGDVTPVVDGLYFADALGTQGSLLLHKTTSPGRDVSVYDGKTVRALTTGVCDHLPTPDGSRVYVVRECADEVLGNLEVVDVVTGKATAIDRRVERGSLALSPSARWLAYTSRSTSTAEGDLVRVAGAGQEPYTLASWPNATDPAFVSESLLVFRNTKCAGGSASGCEVRGHVPGTGDTSYRIDTRDSGFVGGYQLSPDRTSMLTAEPPSTASTSGPFAKLYAAQLDGSGQRLLASNLFSYWISSMLVRAFAFDSQGKHVLYVSSGSPYGVYAVDLGDNSARKLSGYGRFQLTATGGSVVLFEQNPDSNGGSVRLTDLASGTDRLSFTTAGGVWTATPLASDQALLFVERASGGLSRLRHMSADHPDSVVLGEWKESMLRWQYPSYAEPEGLYPVDPSGCFTIVDTDLAPGPGTRLVLLPR